jgi:hypothetical protein
MINAHLGEDTEIAVLVLRELSIESLQQFPDIRRSGLGAGGIVGAVGEAHTNGLVNVKNVGVFVEAVLVQRRRLRSVDEVAGAVLLEQADHGRASRTTVEPGGQRSTAGVGTGLEEPVRVS